MKLITFIKNLSIVTYMKALFTKKEPLLIKPKNKATALYNSLLLLTLPFLATSAHASALGKLTTIITSWKDEFYILIGIISFGYVMWTGLKAKFSVQGTQWIDVAIAVFHVAIAGGIPAAVIFAWTFFS
jgi:hypothetical protein